MKISTKGRYGLRCLIDLAVHSHGDQVAIKSIAERQEISENYLEQVFSALRKAGIVKSIKGSQGGYVLAYAPADIRVGDVIRALEGKIEVAEGSEEKNKPTSRIDQVITRHVWDEMNKQINGIIDSITLEDLINEYRRLNGANSYMFYI